MTTKFRVLKTYVWSTLTYGCECWTITSDIEKKIEAAEMWFIRRMLRISWAEKKTNVNVLREGNVQRSLLKKHVLQTCSSHKQLRARTWPNHTPLEKKLYGTTEELALTVDYIVASGLTV